MVNTRSPANKASSAIAVEAWVPLIRESPSLGASVRGRIPAEFIDWSVSVSNDTKAMRHERQMVRSVVEGAGWKPGLVFE